MVRKKRPWSLLSSHGLVLITVARLGSLTVPDIAEKTGLSRSTVLHCLKDLRRVRMLKVKRRGRRNEYNIEGSVSFRHPIVRDTPIGELIGAVAPRSK